MKTYWMPILFWIAGCTEAARTETPTTAASQASAKPSASTAAADPAPVGPCGGKDLDLAALLANKACKAEAPITRSFAPGDLSIGLRPLSTTSKGGDIVDFEVSLENKTAAVLAMTLRCVADVPEKSPWGDAFSGGDASGLLLGSDKPSGKKPSKKADGKASSPRVFPAEPEPPGSAPGFTLEVDDATGRTVKAGGLETLMQPAPCKVELSAGGRAHARVRWKAVGVPKDPNATSLEPVSPGVYTARIRLPFVGATDVDGKPLVAKGTFTIRD
jgi:hypothetical protein